MSGTGRVPAYPRGFRRHGQGSCVRLCLRPEIIRDATGDITSQDQVGGADMHGAISGEAHFVVQDDAQALTMVRRLLSFVPSNNLEDPPHRFTESIDFGPDPKMDVLAPGGPTEEIDIDAVITRLVDGGDFLEVHSAHARNLVVGFGRIEGCVVGILANRGADKGGTLDIDASDKGARFVRFCDLFNIPLVSLIDTPGFLPGLAQERGGLARHAAKLIFGMIEASVPKVSIVVRKAFVPPTTPWKPRNGGRPCLGMAKRRGCPDERRSCGVHAASGHDRCRGRSCRNRGGARRPSSGSRGFALCCGGARRHHRRDRTVGNPCGGGAGPAQPVVEARGVPGPQIRERAAVSAIKVLAVGVVVVLGVLAFLWAATACVGGLFRAVGAVRARRDAKVADDRPVGTEDVVPEVPPEHLAAIAAAVASILDARHRIVRIAIPTNTKPSWTLAGRLGPHARGTRG